MSVETDYAPVEEAGNGSKTAFDFAFKILASSDLVVRKKSAAGVYTDPLTLNSDYTVAFDSDAETGTVTYIVAPVSGGASNIQRSSDDEQSTVLPREGTLPAKTLETAIDKLTLLMQEISDKLTRVPSYAAVPPDADPITIQAPVDGRGIKWVVNADDTITLANAAYDPDVIAAAALAGTTKATISAIAGLAASKPAAPTTTVFYISTDLGNSVELWLPDAGKWILIG